VSTTATLSRLRAASALVLLLAAAICAARGTEATLAGRHTVYWEPEGASAGPQPLLLFSHGYGGCATQSTFLMEALAKDGYWVFAPDHRDARCGHAVNESGQFSLKEFRTPEQWTEASHADRRDDLQGLLQALQTDPRFAGRIDFSRLGLLGHSLGGYTVLGLAGAWPGWRMDGVRAVLALSPFSQPFNLRRTVAAIHVPVMFQGGTLDVGISPSVRKGDGSYEQANAPKYYVEFARSGHFVWTDLNRRHAESVIAYSEAFLDRYVKGDLASGDLTLRRRDVSRLLFDSELGRSDGPAQR